MTTAIRCAISPFAQPEKEVNSNAIRILDETLTSVPASAFRNQLFMVRRARNT